MQIICFGVTRLQNLSPTSNTLIILINACKVMKYKFCIIDFYNKPITLKLITHYTVKIWLSKINFLIKINYQAFFSISKSGLNPWKCLTHSTACEPLAVCWVILVYSLSSTMMKLQKVSWCNCTRLGTPGTLSINWFITHRGLKLKFAHAFIQCEMYPEDLTVIMYPWFVSFFFLMLYDLSVKTEF